MKTEPLRPAVTMPRTPHIAVLRSRAEPETLLRVAFYPSDRITYCGLWHDGDLLLGWSTVDGVCSPDDLFLAARVELIGARMVRELRLLALWEQPESRSAPARPVTADATVLAADGSISDRLVLVDPTVVDWSRFRHPEPSSN